MRLLYNLLVYLLLPFALLRLLVRSFRSPEYRRDLRQRFGFIPQQTQSCLWFHAVSVGETIAVIPIIKQLLTDRPTLNILLTNTTPAGRERAIAAFKDKLPIFYMPYDTPGAVKRFIRRAQPYALVLIETELWPNVLAVCRQHAIKTFLLNARLSARSARGYARAQCLLGNLFEQLDHVAVQAEPDRRRFIVLGVKPSHIETVGSVKYDLSVPETVLSEAQKIKAQIDGRPIWVASSTHPKEEEMVLTAHQQIRQQFPSALLILVPRHPARFDGVAGLLNKQAVSFKRRQGGDLPQIEDFVWLGDTMGEMLLFNAIADVVFVAGSLVPVGGHNTMEPAVLAKPIIQGPYWHNFAEATRLLTKANAIVQIQDAASLAQSVMAFFENPSEAHAQGARAKAVIAANRGSLDKQVQLLQQNIFPLCAVDN